MKDILLKFIEKTGSKAEIEMFWKEFLSLPKLQFAVINVSYEVLKEELDMLSENIALMNQLEIFPLLIFNTQTAEYNPNIPDSGFDEATQKRLFTLYSHRFIKEMRNRKAKAKIVDAFAENPGKKTPALLVSKLATCIQKTATPIVNNSILQSRKRHLLDPTLIATQLIKTISPKKYILLNEEGGLLDDNDVAIPFLNVSHPSEWTHSVNKAMHGKVRDIRKVLTSAPDTAIVITSADHLLKEIFTVKGKGTFIKVHHIVSANQLAELDQTKLKILLENAFEKKLVDTYFKEKVNQVFYQKDYEGVAIVQDINGIPYLDKFAVAKICEGTGLGKSLWLKVSEKFPQLIWRSTPSNPLNNFYMRECDGCMKFEDWHVFWRDVPQKNLLDLIRKVRKKPLTLVKG